MVSWFGSQNQVGFGLSVAPQNRQMEVGAVHTSRSSDLLRIEASLVMVFQSGLKTDRCVMAGAARGTITEVASESSQCDGLRWTLLPLLYRFHSIRS
jgi:hypothetical protein